MPTSYAGDEIQLDKLIDLKRYPIHDLNSPVRKALLAHCREQLEEDGCVVIEALLLAPTTQAMAAEAARLLPQAYRSRDKHNPYFTAPSNDPTQPEGFVQTRTSAYIVSDVIEPDSTLRQLYDSDVLLHFIGECLNTGPIYRWADTLARCPYGVMECDDYFPWHFDGNDFTVTMLVQPPDKGGVFEYIPRVRAPQDENIPKVMSVLKGDREGVKQLPLRRGDMQLFKGRYSMHRVTQVQGSQTRIVAIPSYVRDPYSVTNVHHAECLYGRSSPIHHERSLSHGDELIG